MALEGAGRDTTSTKGSAQGVSPTSKVKIHLLNKQMPLVHGLRQQH